MDIDHAFYLRMAGETLEVSEVMEAVSANPDFLHSRSRIGKSTILELAVNMGSTELVSSLLLAGANPNCFKSPNDTPLIIAIRSTSTAKIEIARLLIQHGANVNAAGVLDGSALHAAVAVSSSAMVTLLLESGADINIREAVDGETPIWLACLTENEEMVQFLLTHGADLRLRDQTMSMAPLDVALRTGNVSMMSILLNAGADPNERGLGREVPLTQAILYGLPNVLEVLILLIKYGANVDAPGECIASPLHAAIMKGQIQSVELLLRHGADANKESPLDQLTPLKIAVAMADKPIEALLRSHGAEK